MAAIDASPSASSGPPRWRRWLAGPGRLDGATDAPRAATAAAAKSLVQPVARPDRVAQAGLMAWAPVFLSLGIGGWFALTVEPGPRAYAGVLAAALVALALSGRLRRLAQAGRIGWDRADALRLTASVVALVAVGFLAAGLRAHSVAGPVMDYRYYGPIEGRVAEIDRSARDRMRLTLDQVVLRDTAPDRTPLRVRLSLTEPQPLPAPGARVMLTGHLGPPPGPAEPNGFDFRRAAFFESLGAVGYTRTPIMTVTPAPPRWWNPTTLRMRLSAAIQDWIGGQEGAVAAALMTGDRSGIAEATNAMMRDSNLYHIISISGLHMSMLAGFVYAALRLLVAASLAGPGGALAGRPTHKVAAAGALAAATGYLLLSGGGVPTERAWLMVAVMLGAILVDRRAASLRTIAVAAVVILLMAPEALVTPGFQMSFAATAALILVFPIWSRRAQGLPWWIRGVVMLILSSLIAGIATTPIAAAHFNRSAQYGIIANLLVVPVMGAVVMPAGVLAAILGPLGLAGPALWAMGLGCWWMLTVGELVAGWGGAVMAVPAPHWTVLPLMGTGATVLVLLLPRRALGRGAWAAVALAALAVGLAAAVWFATPRPVLLVAGDGSAVGLMTDQGRALAKPAGAFVANNWLRADGDTGGAEAAAARPGWTGARGARAASLLGKPLVQLSGKGAADRVAQACAQGGIVVLAGRLDPPAGGEDGSGAATARDARRTAAKGPCLLLDERALMRSGAMAAWVDNGALRWLSAEEATGARLWNTARVRRDWGYGGTRRAWRRAAAGSGATPGRQGQDRGKAAGPEAEDRAAAEDRATDGQPRP